MNRRTLAKALVGLALCPKSLLALDEPDDCDRIVTTIRFAGTDYALGFKIDREMKNNELMLRDLLYAAQDTMYHLITTGKIPDKAAYNNFEVSE